MSEMMTVYVYVDSENVLHYCLTERFWDGWKYLGEAQMPRPVKP